jgi:hypothetical protein
MRASIPFIKFRALGTAYDFLSGFALSSAERLLIVEVWTMTPACFVNLLTARMTCVSHRLHLSTTLVCVWSNAESSRGWFAYNDDALVSSATSVVRFVRLQFDPTKTLTHIRFAYWVSWRLWVVLSCIGWPTAWGGDMSSASLTFSRASRCVLFFGVKCLEAVGLARF